MNELVPLFLKLQGRRALVVGGGAMAAQRVRQLAAAGARIAVVAPEIRPEIVPLAEEIHRRPFVAPDLNGAWLCVAAAPPEVNREVARAAEARRVFVNAVDDVAAASAYCAGVVRKGGVVLAVSTEGRAPALAGLLREALEALLPAEVAGWTKLAERLRAEWKAAKVPMGERRPMLLRALEALYAARSGPSPRPSPAGAGEGDQPPTSKTRDVGEQDPFALSVAPAQRVRSRRASSPSPSPSPSSSSTCRRIRSRPLQVLP